MLLCELLHQMHRYRHAKQHHCRPPAAKHVVKPENGNQCEPERAAHDDSEGYPSHVRVWPERNEKTKISGNEPRKRKRKDKTPAENGTLYFGGPDRASDHFLCAFRIRHDYCHYMPTAFAFHSFVFLSLPTNSRLSFCPDDQGPPR